jgi:Ni,Fe-hydrogenase III small subunit
MIDEFKIISRNGYQYIPNIRRASVPLPFRGRPEISDKKVNEREISEICPTNAISSNPFQIDLKKCLFCGECAFKFPEKIKFTNDHRLASNNLENLIITEGKIKKIEVEPAIIRREIKDIFKRSFKLRQVSAGGDNSTEMELNACGNANFDMGRFGIEFVASPRHADGIVVTGPISANMAEALEIAYVAIPEPKVFILCGTDSISSGIFNGSEALNRGILNKIVVDLYIPGNPPHPLTIINGLLDLIDS